MSISNGSTTARRDTHCADIRKAITLASYPTMRSRHCCRAAPTQRSEPSQTSACRRMAVRSRTCPIRTPRLPSAVPPSSTSPRAGGPTRPKDDRRMALARRTAVALDPFARGQYVNTLSDEGAEGVRRVYPPDKLARLTAVKDRYDPENVFHLNHNIRPSVQRRAIG